MSALHDPQGDVSGIVLVEYVTFRFWGDGHPLCWFACTVPVGGLLYFAGPPAGEGVDEPHREIITKVEAVKADIDDANEQGVQARQKAVELTEEAAGHGWEGVANAMQGACEALEQVSASLSTAERATGEALSALRSITDQTSRPKVAAVLGQVLSSYDQVRTAIDAASSGADDARNAADQAGNPQSLMGMIQSIHDTVSSIWRALDAAKGTTESEQQETSAWGNAQRAAVAAPADRPSQRSSELARTPPLSRRSTAMSAVASPPAGCTASTASR
jgi:hypothetical protein